MKLNSKMLLILAIFSLSTCLLQAAEQKEQSEKNIFEAIRYGSFEPVNDLILAGADLNIKDEEGNTPLIKAVELAKYYKYYIDISFVIDSEEAEERLQGWKESRSTTRFC